MSYLPAPDRTAVKTTTYSIEGVGYGDIRVQHVSTSLTANFTQPAVHGTVTATVGSSTAFVAGDTVAISGSLAGYRGGIYYVVSKPSSTSMVLKLVEDGAAPGATVSSGADVRSVIPILMTPRNRGQLVVTDLYIDSLQCPGFGDTTRATVSIGWNKGGTPFSEYYSAQQLNFVSTLSNGVMATSLGATFTQPAVGATATVTLATPAVYVNGTWAYPNGTIIRINRGGVYEVTSQITTTTTANYTQPAVSGSVVISVSSTTDFAVGEYIWVSSGSTLGAGVYSITAKTATSLTCTLVTLGSSFLPGIASASVVASGATVTHATKMIVTLLRDQQAGTGQTLASGNSVWHNNDGKATTTAAFTQPVSGSSVTVTMNDNRRFVVGTTVWVNVGFDNSAGLYTIASKTGLDRMSLTLSTAINYATGSSVPSGSFIHVRRQSGQVLPLRGTGTTRITVDAGYAVAMYVSVSSNATSAAVVAVHVRGYYTS